MNETSGVKEKGVQHRRVHMANERTFLAWIRTSIGLMAFGFVVEKFSIFIRQVAYFLQSNGVHTGALGRLPVTPPSGYSSALGILLVALGTLMSLLAFIRYKKVERQIDEDNFRPSFILDIMITLTILAVGIFLVIYLIHSI